MAEQSNSVIANEEAVDETGYVVDTSDGAQAYLTFHAKLLNLRDGIDVLVINNLIFHDQKVLLIRLQDAIQSWGGRIGGPVFRVRCPGGEHGLELLLLNTAIDKTIPEADDISVAEFSRVAARTQVGLDPSDFRNSKAATALLTAVTPGGLKATTWLRASLFWTVGEEVVPQPPQGSVASEAWWATREEVEKLDENDFFLGLKDDLVRAFDLRKVY